MTDIYQYSASTIKGEQVSLADYRGKVVLIVNTASKCGLTPQFEGLEKLHEKYRERGLAILGFPCNQFREQDPGSDTEIEQFCQVNYGVTFPMFAKIDVNGPTTHPLESSCTRDIRQRKDQMEFHQIPDQSQRRSRRAFRAGHETRKD